MGPLGSAPISQMGKPIQLRMRRQAQKQDTAGLQPALQKVPKLSVWPHPKPLSFPQQAPLGEGTAWWTRRPRLHRESALGGVAWGPLPQFPHLYREVDSTCLIRSLFRLVRYAAPCLALGHWCTGSAPSWLGPSLPAQDSGGVLVNSTAFWGRWAHGQSLRLWDLGQSLLPFLCLSFPDYTVGL